MFRFFAVLCLVAACNAGIPIRAPLPYLPIPQPTAGKIVGGVIIDITDQPHQVAQLAGTSLTCGASIGSTTVMIGAGHCASGSAGSYNFRVGSSFHASGGQVHSVSRVLRHEQYDSFDIDYDVALFFLSSPITLSDSARVVALPAVNKPVPGGSAAVTSGWGTTSEGGSISSQLRKVEIPIVDQSTCISAYAQLGWLVSDRMICAGNLASGGQDACQGDSGGPLVVAGELVGITSWGYGCARPGYPGVWARVPALVSWINSNMG